MESTDNDLDAKSKRWEYVLYAVFIQLAKIRRIHCFNFFFKRRETSYLS